MIYKFVFYGEPKPKQSARFRIQTGNGKSFIKSYQKKSVVDNEKSLAMDCKAQMIQQGCKISDKAIKIISLCYVFSPISTLKKAEKLLIHAYEGMEATNCQVIFKTTKPDLTDNLNKGLFDALQGILYHNDSQICEMQNVRKVYGETPRIILTVEMEV